LTPKSFLCQTRVRSSATPSVRLKSMKRSPPKPVAARVVGEHAEREDRVTLPQRHEVPPFAAELDERRGAAEPAVRHLEVGERERAVRRDVEGVPAVVGERHLVRPVDGRVEEPAGAQVRIRRADERDVADLAALDGEPADAHPVREVDAREKPDAGRRLRHRVATRVVGLAAERPALGQADRFGRRVVPEAEEPVGRVPLVHERREDEGAAFPVAAVGELELVVLVLGRRLADQHRVAAARRRIPEEAERREDALRPVVPDVGREHVANLVLLVEKEDDAEEPARVPFVRIRDDLRDRDEARRRGGGPGPDERRPEHARGQRAP